MNLGVSFFVLFANLYSSKWEHSIHFLFHTFVDAFIEKRD